MSQNRTLVLIGNAAVVLLGALAVLLVLVAPVDTAIKIILLAVLAVFAAPILLLRGGLGWKILFCVAAVGVLVIANLEPIFNWVVAALQWIFNPNRVDPSTVIVCRESSGCMTVYSFLYSAILLFVFLTGFVYTTLLERRFIAWLQHRVGPNRVGPKGLLQPLADAIKLVTKEDITPSGASYYVWFLAPMIKAVPVLIILAVLPLGPDLVIPWFDGHFYQIPLALSDSNVGILWLLAITSIGTYGVVLAGWSSNNKYAMIGGLRATAQMISYELSLGLAMAVPVMLAGSLSVGDIIRAQDGVFLSWFVFQNPLAAAILIIALIAEVNRAPFDLPEAEQELTAGFMTEYSGMKFALFMMAEYLGMIVVSIIVSSMFFGGYQDGFGLVDSLPILGPLVMIGKIVICLLGFVWIRATLPRIRYDRLMVFGWKVMLPLALVAVSWSAVSIVIGDLFQSTLAYAIASGVFFVVALAGGLIFLGRAGRLAGEEEEAALEDDPMVTGERRGIGWAVIQVVGGLLAVLFALVEIPAWMLDVVRKIGEKPQKEIVESQPSERAPAKQSGGD